MDASDPKQVRRAQKDAKVRDKLRQDFVRNSMSTIAGRAYIYDVLNLCHVFGTSFALNGLQMAFNEGERNVGLRVLNDIMQAAPESYPLMMREANERHITGERTGGETADGRTEDERSDDDDRGGSTNSVSRSDAPDPFGYYKGRADN